MIHELAQLLVDTVFDWGYFGIYLLMSIESSFIPFPSEIVLVPAGYLASNGEMSVFMIMLCALGGSLSGAFINYFLALSLGRKFLLKYGRYFFISEKSLINMEHFFQKYGAISTFTGRLIPGIRQLISIPAGIARMNLVQFTIFTSLGAGLWAFILVMLGYFVGENEELINVYLKQITFALLACLFIIAYVYYTIKKKRSV